MTIIGFDVSKHELVGVRVNRRAQSKETFIIHNDAVAIGSLLDTLIGHRGLLVASESTAEYHRTLAKECIGRNIPFRLINPITTKQFTRATVRKQKTDLSDALIIAKLALQGEGTLASAAMFASAKPVSRTAVKLRQMVHMLNLMQQRFTAALPDEPELLQYLRAPQEALEASVAALRERAVGYTDPALQRLLATIPGIGPTIASILVAEIGSIERFTGGKALVAYAGLDPKVRQSGISLKSNARLTKRGSPYLRRAIYLAAVVASRFDPELRNYYLKKRSEGRRYREAMVATARKLLYRVYAVWTRGTPYVKTTTPPQSSQCAPSSPTLINHESDR